MACSVSLLFMWFSIMVYIHLFLPLFMQLMGQLWKVFLFFFNGILREMSDGRWEVLFRVEIKSGISWSGQKRVQACKKGSQKVTQKSHVQSLWYPRCYCSLRCQMVYFLEDPFNTTSSRARWIGHPGQKMVNTKTGHMYSYVKLNFKVGLFLAFFDLRPPSFVNLTFYFMARAHEHGP